MGFGSAFTRAFLGYQEMQLRREQMEQQAEEMKLRAKEMDARVKHYDAQNASLQFDLQNKQGLQEYLRSVIPTTAFPQAPGQATGGGGMEDPEAAAFGQRNPTPVSGVDNNKLAAYLTGIQGMGPTVAQHYLERAPKALTPLEEENVKTQQALRGLVTGQGGPQGGFPAPGGAMPAPGVQGAPQGAPSALGGGYGRPDITMGPQGLTAKFSPNEVTTHTPMQTTNPDGTPGFTILQSNKQGQIQAIPLPIQGVGSAEMQKINGFVGGILKLDPRSGPGAQAAWELAMATLRTGDQQGITMDDFEKRWGGYMQTGQVPPPLWGRGGAAAAPPSVGAPAAVSGPATSAAGPGTVTDRAADAAAKRAGKVTAAENAARPLNNDDQAALIGLGNVVGSINEVRATDAKATEKFIRSNVRQSSLLGEAAKKGAGQISPTVRDTLFENSQEFLAWKANVGRLRSTVFELAGKQVTGLEKRLTEYFTPTGEEAGGAREFNSKLANLERFTKLASDVRNQLAREGKGGLDTAEVERRIEAAMKKAGIGVPKNTGSGKLEILSVKPISP